MALEEDLKEFSYGETMQFTTAIKNRDQTAIDDAANVTVEFIVSLGPSKTNLLKFDASPQIVLQDAPTGMWNFTFKDLDFATLSAGKPYNYEIWSTDTTGDIEIHQVKGSMVLLPATGPD